MVWWPLHTTLQASTQQIFNEHLLCAYRASHLYCPTLPDFWSPLQPAPRPEGLSPDANPAVPCPNLKPVGGHPDPMPAHLEHVLFASP